MADRGRLVPAHFIQLRDPQPPLLGHPPLPAHVLVEAPLLRRLPLPTGPIPSIIALEDKLMAQSREIHGLLADNQHLAATHVGLKQEVDASRHELRLAVAAASRARAELDVEVREVVDRSVKAEAEARAIEGMRVELTQVRADVRNFEAVKNELLERLQVLKRDFARAREELGQASAVRAEIEAMTREIKRGRAAVEYEKKARADNLEQRQEMERNVISMAREVEKLRSELGNAEKRVRAAAAAAVTVTEIPVAGYTDAYRNARVTYGGNAYSMAYDLRQVQQTGTDVGSQYGQVTAPQGSQYISQQTHFTR